MGSLPHRRQTPHKVRESPEWPAAFRRNTHLGRNLSFVPLARDPLTKYLGRLAELDSC
jgi:hypothetical protein